MIFDLLVAFLAGLLGSYVFSILSDKMISTRLYSLEVDLADLQDRHLRAVRKAAVGKRWDKDEELDLQLEQALTSKPEPEKKGFKKWASTSENF